MRGRSSSKQGRGVRGRAESMEVDSVDKVKEEPHLSGAYIRSLVKHLTSSRTKDSTTGEVDGDGIQKNQSKIGGESIGDHSQESQQQQPVHKKQVRRRLHTSRPYQERLLNMAEARREIVTALKFHRASMKQQEANNNNNNQDHQSQPPVAQPSLPQEAKSKSRRNSRVYASPTTAATSTVNGSSTTNYLEPYTPITFPPPMPYYWPVSAIAAPPPLPLIPDNFNMVLPNQPLGLTLNFHCFHNLDASVFHNPLSLYTSSSSSSSPSASSPSLSVVTDEMMAVSEEVAAYSLGGTTMNGSGILGGEMHHAMDTEEMRELRSISEQHQMEWNDTLNMVTSARWSKFLKTMEIGGEDEKGGAHEEEGDDGYNPFDQVMEFPPWLVNPSDRCSLQDDHFSEDYSQDPALPCMDIGEIDGIDGEWLA